MLDPLRPLRFILRVFPLKRRNRHNNPIQELPIVTDDQRIPPEVLHRVHIQVVRRLFQQQHDQL